ncbi:MAG: enoyl-CoA hydratase [Pseudomonadota bacterium]
MFPSMKPPSVLVNDEEPEYETKEPVSYRVEENVAWVTLNRPRYFNAQNLQLLYAIDDLFRRAVDDHTVKAIVLGGTGKHFSVGHDIGSPGRDFHKTFNRRDLLPDHTEKPGAEWMYTQEKDSFLGLCRRWNDIPKPTIAMVQGGCIAAGLMLAWTCDLIIASDDAFFQDPVAAMMGVPGVEYFAHAYELPSRVAKEFLLLGERMSAERAYQYGMVNRVVPRDELEATVKVIAEKLTAQSSMSLWLAKQAVNHADEVRGKRATMDGVFHMHHLAHAHSLLTTGSPANNQDAKSMSRANKKNT